MKNALVVYESMFGATRQVAEAVADGLSRSTRCTVVEVGGAPTVVDRDVDLLVIGAPHSRLRAVHAGHSPRGAEGDEHAGHLARPRGPGVAGRTGPPVARTRTAAFDTHVKQRWVPGSAAHKIAHSLAHKGLTQAHEPVSFRVDGTTGPLLDGELTRAQKWGAELRSLTRGRSAGVPRPQLTAHASREAVGSVEWGPCALGTSPDLRERGGRTTVPRSRRTPCCITTSAHMSRSGEPPGLSVATSSSPTTVAGEVIVHWNRPAGRPICVASGWSS
jgi:hypothetical protein